jgi:hypothetical protein
MAGFKPGQPVQNLTVKYSQVPGIETNGKGKPCKGGERRLKRQTEVHRCCVVIANVELAVQQRRNEM